MKEKPEVIEHPDTITIVRKDYRDQVYGWLRNNFERHKEFPSAFQDIIDGCTTLQLRALCRLIEREHPDLTLLRCNPRDHMAVTFAGIYVGIGTDGYTHS